MSVSSDINQVIFTGSGTTGPFDFDFKIFESSDLKIEKFTIATETSVTMTETTDYTVAIDGDGTGAVTLVAVLSSAYKLIITRELPLTQEISYVEGDKFPAVTHEEALDRAAMRDQQLKEELDRCVKVVAGSTTTPDELVDTLVEAAADAEQAATDAETAQTAAEAAQAIAEAAAGSMTLASQAEAEAGTENTKYLSSLRTAQAIAKLSKATVKVGSFTRDMTAASGDVAYTGVGFIPKIIIFFGNDDSSASAAGCSGFDDGTNKICQRYYGEANTKFSLITTASISITNNAGTADQKALVKTFDADGFTLTWTKSGSPTGTGTVGYLAIR